jgi:4-hydroxy 2-oxovalerate aldolase
MLSSTGENISFLDCTLRDGGYYTNWDFEKELVNDYIIAINELPVDYVEVGYRSKEKSTYRGAFFYLPIYLLEEIKSITTKKIVVILDQKDVLPQDIPELLSECRGLVDVVRIAVAPTKIDEGLLLAAAIKREGFKVCFNLMYASRWDNDFPGLTHLEQIQEKIDVLYVVDSYGGMYPSDVEKIFRRLKDHLSINLGFHGHNNLEMAMANTLSAIEAGATYIDSTILGMGRGAGNLKTELLLTILHQKKNLPLNFDALNNILEPFRKLRNLHGWGSSLPYIASGAFSLPQDSVHSRVKKRYYSLNAIVSEVNENTIPEAPDFPVFKAEGKVEKVFIIGGGENPQKYFHALLEYFSNHPDIPIIHSSSKNIFLFKDLDNPQYYSISGMEGKRFETVFPDAAEGEKILVTPPEPKYNGTYIPKNHISTVYRLEGFSLFSVSEVSATAMCLEIAVELGAQQIFLSGYDGYQGAVTKVELELFEENQELFEKTLQHNKEIFSVTPTNYNINSKSIFTLV